MSLDTIQFSLFDYFMDDEKFTLKEATELVKVNKNMQVNDESIRARIYEGIDRGIFRHVARGVYKVEKQLEGKLTTCLLINGNGRDLSFIKDKSIDGIVTDHPYDLSKSLTGGNRKFAQYELVNYPLSKANGLPASMTSQPTISTGVNSGCTIPICILLSYAICRNPSAKIFFAALTSLSCFVLQIGHTHSLTDKSFVAMFLYPQAEHNWLLA